MYRTSSVIVLCSVQDYLVIVQYQYQTTQCTSNYFCSCYCFFSLLKSHQDGLVGEVGVVGGAVIGVALVGDIGGAGGGGHLELIGGEATWGAGDRIKQGLVVQE